MSRAAMLDPEETRQVVLRALAEDFRYGPDVTSMATASPGASVTGEVVARSAGIVAGLPVAQAVAGALPAFGAEMAGVEATALRADGDRIEPGDAVLRVRGPAAAVLSAERTLLNFLTHMSGIATLTRLWVDAVEGTGAAIRDTRKTLPGLRSLEKYAVRCGGGVNHRMGLGDAALIKDNHIVAAGSVAKAIAAVRAAAPDIPLEVECDTLAEVRESLEAGARFILLDNMPLDALRAAVAEARRYPGACLEASGGLRLETARDVAMCGVDYLAVGALTHSSPALDLGLDFLTELRRDAAVTVAEVGTVRAGDGAGHGGVLGEARRRRTFAVISHPDAGKSTLTEALALHARAINQAGAVHGKAGRRGVTSDWMAMEKDRGISITSAALKFDYDGYVLNLLDTPGHADFSEDTYRVLEAVDCAIMLLDSAKGLEPQTLKLFDVCRSRHVPVVTFVNKWDRPGREPLELLDEIEQRIGLRPTPVNWPVGIAGDFRGLIERSSGVYTAYTRMPGGALRALEEVFPADEALARDGAAYSAATEELELLEEIGATVDMPSFLAGESSPVLFGAALPNFGVRRLLDAMCSLAPAPLPRADVAGSPRAVDASFSGLVFKVQANMNPAHRDRVAFVRVCSGRFERGMVLTHAATGRPFATKYAQEMFGQDRETLDVAFPGDVIGLVNAGALRPGDTLYASEPVEFPPIPSFAPEHFAVVRCKDAGKFKQFRRGIDQLDTEGVVQVLSSDLRGDQAPVLAAVGPLQFDVVLHRLEHEFGAKSELTHLDYELARLTSASGAEELKGIRGCEVLTRRLDGALLALFADKWRLNAIQRDHPGVQLDQLLAGVAS